MQVYSAYIHASKSIYIDPGKQSVIARVVARVLITIPIRVGCQGLKRLVGLMSICLQEKPPPKHLAQVQFTSSIFLMPLQPCGRYSDYTGIISSCLGQISALYLELSGMRGAPKITSEISLGVPPRTAQRTIIGRPKDLVRLEDTSSKAYDALFY